MTIDHHLDNGWYKIIEPNGDYDIECIIDDALGYGIGVTVKQCIEWGYTFEPATVMTKAEYEEIVCERDALKTENQNWQESVVNLAQLAQGLIAETEDLQREVSERNEKLLLLTADPESLEAKVLGYQEVAEEWQRITGQATQQIVNLCATIDNLSKVNQELNTDKESLGNLLETVKAENKRLRQQYDDTVGRNEQLTEDKEFWRKLAVEREKNPGGRL